MFVSVCFGLRGYAAEPPYSPSAVIQGISFDDGKARTEAPGSDNWPIAWAANGHLYTSFGDGGGFGGTNSDSRVSNFVNKWLSADGRRFVLVHTKNDHWASIAGEFLLADPN